MALTGHHRFAKKTSCSLRGWMSSYNHNLPISLLWPPNKQCCHRQRLSRRVEKRWTPFAPKRNRSSVCRLQCCFSRLLALYAVCLSCFVGESPKKCFAVRHVHRQSKQ